jgi:hypothetical protein
MDRKSRRRDRIDRKQSRRAGSVATLQDKPRGDPERAFLGILAAGIVIRILVFAFMGYFNNDNHIAVVEYVSRHWMPPQARQFNQGYHPPLYYFLAAPLFRLGRLAAVQGLSLLLSIATLLLIAALLRRLDWIKATAQLSCLALAAFHPQFVVFSLFISNDTLAIFLGVLIFFQCRRVQGSVAWRDDIVLGIMLALGLLTKAVFLAFVFPLAMFLCFERARQELPRSQIAARLAIMIGCAGALGSYKYVENFLLFGNPAINNLDFADWIAEQQPTWVGIGSLLDFNIFKLVQYPVASSSTVHSYLLMIYGSFWYAFLPESTFRGNLIEPLSRIGSLIYIAALWPTVLMAIGGGRIGFFALKSLWAARSPTIAPRSDRSLFEATAVLSLLLNILLVIAIGWHYDVWSVFQGRLIFPAYVGVLVALNLGIECSASSQLKKNLTRYSLAALAVLFLAYYATEFWLAGTYPINPLRMHHMPYTIDMKGL